MRVGAASVCLLSLALPLRGQDATPLPPLPIPVAPGQSLTLSQAIEIGERQSPVHHGGAAYGARRAREPVRAETAAQSDFHVRLAQQHADPYRRHASRQREQLQRYLAP